jgi:tripartite ATP-independent transporter DctM subunit
MAEIIVASDIGKDLFEGINIWIGRVRGGVSAATLIGCSLFAAVSGSSTATIAAVGTVSLWEMINMGYDKNYACGTVGVGGTLGVMIPPSIIMILYGALTDQSIGKLFIAGVVPGIIMGVGYVGMTIIRAYLNHDLAPVTAKKLPLRYKLRAVRSVIPFSLIFIAMFWAFYTGVATPTEVAALGVLAALILAFAMRRLKWQKVYEATRRAGVTTVFILFIIAGAKFFAFTISATGISGLLSEYLSGLGLSPTKLVILMMLVYLILGCFIDPAGALTLTIPFFMPTLIANNINLIWFGTLATVNLELGTCTPPFGFNLYIVKGIGPPEITMKNVIMGVLPFLLVDFLLLALVLIFPELALWLPSHM